LHYGDLTDSGNIIRIIQEIQPDEIYNLGAMSHVKVSFDTPEYTANVDGLGTLRILEAVDFSDLSRKPEFIRHQHQNFMGWYRKHHNLRLLHFIPVRHMPLQTLRILDYEELQGGIQYVACNGILFNHESPLRGETFVTRKITRAVAV
jgi:GDPmannose 4,6-dehydratase